MIPGAGTVTIRPSTERPAGGGAAGRGPRVLGVRRRWRTARPSGLLAVSVLVVAVLMLPLVFLLVEAQGSGIGKIIALIGRPLTAQLLWNTVRLAVVVTVLCAVIGTGAAWLTERTDLPGRRIWAVLIVVPLAIPDFVVSFGWASLSTAIAGYPRRGPGDDSVGIPACLPASCRQPAQRRPRSGGNRPQPGRRETPHLLAHHRRPGPRRHPGRMPARHPGPARRVRRLRDPRLPDLHDRDLHGDLGAL